MQKLLMHVAVALCFCAAACAQNSSATTPPAASAPSTQPQTSTAAPTQPVHRKPQTYTPGSPETPASAAAQPEAAAAAPEFDHIGIEVRDLARSADFYQRVVGLVQIADPFNDAQHIFLRLGAHSQLHLVKKAAATSAATPRTTGQQASSKSGDVHFAIRVANVAEFAAKLDRQKVAFRDTNDQPHKLTKRPDGVIQIYFQDPDGYWIEVNDDK